MEFKDKKAIYLQIAALFCENILQKKWKADEKIPSIREMAVELEVNPNTTMRTYAYLQDLGIIFNKRGIGYFVANNGFEITQKLIKKQFIEDELPAFFKTLKILNMSVNEIIKLNKGENE